jgi:hypothetical protein
MVIYLYESSSGIGEIIITNLGVVVLGERQSCEDVLQSYTARH